MYRNLLKYSVAGIVIIVPSSKLSTLEPEVIDQIHQLEEILIEEATSVPVYLIQEDEEAQKLYETVQESAESLGATSSAFQSKNDFLNYH